LRNKSLQRPHRICLEIVVESPCSCEWEMVFLSFPPTHSHSGTYKTPAGVFKACRREKQGLKGRKTRPLHVRARRTGEKRFQGPSDPLPPQQLRIGQWKCDIGSEVFNCSTRNLRPVWPDRPEMTDVPTLFCNG